MTNISKDEIWVALVQWKLIEVGKVIYDKLKSIHWPLNQQVICKKFKRGITVLPDDFDQWKQPV